MARSSCANGRSRSEKNCASHEKSCAERCNIAARRSLISRSDAFSLPVSAPASPGVADLPPRRSLAVFLFDRTYVPPEGRRETHCACFRKFSIYLPRREPRRQGICASRRKFFCRLLGQAGRALPPPKPQTIVANVRFGFCLKSSTGAPIEAAHSEFTG